MTASYQLLQLPHAIVKVWLETWLICRGESVIFRLPRLILLISFAVQKMFQLLIVAFMPAPSVMTHALDDLIIFHGIRFQSMDALACKQLPHGFWVCISKLLGFVCSELQVYHFIETNFSRDRSSASCVHVPALPAYPTLCVNDCRTMLVEWDANSAKLVVALVYSLCQR